MCEAFMEFLRDDCVPEKGHGRHGSTMSSRSRKQEIFKKLDNDKVKIWRQEKLTTLSLKILETFLAKNDSELNEAILIVDDNDDAKITSTEDKYFLIAEKFQDRVRKCGSIDGILSYVNTLNQKFKHR